MSKYFAEIDVNGIVKRVIVAESIEWCQNRLGGKWVETVSDNAVANFAGRGYTFHSDKKNFSEPKPFPSWVLDEKCKWTAPIEPPIGKSVVWDEKMGWIEPEPVNVTKGDI